MQSTRYISRALFQTTLLLKAVALACNRQSNQQIIKQEQAKTSLNQFSSEQETEREPEQYHG